MSSDRIRVETLEDIDALDLTPRKAGGVARSLNAGAESVLLDEDWLVEETDLDAIDGQRRVFARVVERATDKAWLFATGETEDWVPTSQSTLFERGTDDEIETLQQQLTAFDRGVEAAR